MHLSGENILFIGSILMFFSIFAGKAGYRFGMPALLLFLGVGMLVGSDGLGIEFHDPAIAQFVGVIALCIILFSGGMDTRISEIKPVLKEGIVLASFGVLIMTVITGLFIYFISGFLSKYISLSITESMLLAAVMSSTDSASVFSILRSKGLSLKQNLRPLLELESGSNDPMAYMLTLLLIQIIQMGELSVGNVAFLLLVQIIVGAGLGYLLGKLTVYIMNKINIQNHSLYSVLLLTCVFFIFSFTDLLRGNGYLAVYIAGLVVGNHKMIHKKSISTFFEGFTWLWQIIMFLTLGLLVNAAELVPVAGIGLAIGMFMILIARPISVFISLLPFKQLSFKGRLYVSWVGLRGAVPIIFATYPLIAGVQNANMIFNVVFFITILSLVIQGTTVTSVAKLLGLADEAKVNNKEFGFEFPEEIKSAMSEIYVGEQLLKQGDKLMDLTLPDNTLVVMVKRDERYFIPKGKTKLISGDKLLVISDNDDELRKTYESLGIKNYTMHKN